VKFPAIEDTFPLMGWEEGGCYIAADDWGPQQVLCEQLDFGHRSQQWVAQGDGRRSFMLIRFDTSGYEDYEAFEVHDAWIDLYAKSNVNGGDAGLEAGLLVEAQGSWSAGPGDGTMVAEGDSSWSHRNFPDQPWYAELPWGLSKPEYWLGGALIQLQGMDWMSIPVRPEALALVADLVAFPEDNAGVYIAVEGAIEPESLWLYSMESDSPPKLAVEMCAIEG
jgi:hypothetical protein